MFSPWREISFVHAVQQPISKVGNQSFPTIATITPDREYGSNIAKLNSKFFVHGLYRPVRYGSRLAGMG
jgi:hypothetical protein